MVTEPFAKSWYLLGGMALICGRVLTAYLWVLGLLMMHKTSTSGFMQHNSQEILYEIYDSLEYQMKMFCDWNVFHCVRFWHISVRSLIYYSGPKTSCSCKGKKKLRNHVCMISGTSLSHLGYFLHQIRSVVELHYPVLFEHRNLRHSPVLLRLIKNQKRETNHNLPYKALA